MCNAFTKLKPLTFKNTILKTCIFFMFGITNKSSSITEALCILLKKRPWKTFVRLHLVTTDVFYA